MVFRFDRTVAFHTQKCLLWLLLSWLLVALASASDFGDIRNRDDSHTKTHFQARIYHSLGEWAQRREQIKNQILVSAGLWPLPVKTALSPRRFDRRVYENYAIEKVVIETFPGFYLAGNLYLPLHRSERAPGILVAHGHWKHGRVHNAEDYSVPALCINLAAQGYVAFAYDMLGYNDTRQLKHDFGDTVEEQLWSFSPLGIQLWNSMRGLDFLESLPEVDPRRLAMTGASGGGTQTFLAAAVDERIQAAAPVNMVSATFQGDDACEMAPGLRIGTNNVEIAALMAPRPMLLISSTRDWTRNTPQEEFLEIRAIYRLYHREDQVANRHINAPHNYNQESREAAYEFFNRVLPPTGVRSATPPRETETFPDKPEALLIGDELLAGESLPQHKELFGSWRISAREKVAGLPPAPARDLLRATLHVKWPASVDTINLGEQLLLRRSGSAECVPARFIPGASDSRVVVVHSHGSSAALNWDKIGEFRKSGSGLLLLDVYQIGAAAAERPATRSDHLVFHPSDDAQRVQDILTGLASLEAPPHTAIGLLCDKAAGLWCWAAAAAAGRPVRILRPGADLAEAERDLPKLLSVPGIERAGGLDLILRLAAEPQSTSSF
jgi:dienelactone hydrolase